MDKEYSSWKVGQLYHAAWLALALAIKLVAVYTREESPSGNLIKLVHYIVKVYAPSWFEIKFSSKQHESRRILFWNFSRIDGLSFDDVKTIAKQNFQKNFFCLLPEKLSVCIDKRWRSHRQKLGTANNHKPEEQESVKFADFYTALTR